MRASTTAAAAAALLLALGAQAALFQPASAQAPRAPQPGANGLDQRKIAAPRFDEDRALAAAVADPARPAADRARDGARHPAESLQFWGLKPGARVIEISPGGGYWTEILAPYARSTGGAYAATAADLDNPKLSEGARKGREAFAAKYAGDRYGQVALVGYGPVAKGGLGAAGSADMVLTARNVHNFLYTAGFLDKVMADSFAVLKPGGVLAVEEHRSDPRPEKPDYSDGYVSEATVIAAAKKAGFVLDARSDINANPRDTKDHPFGVWTLPPTRRSAAAGQPADPAFDAAKYDRIGESDRMTLRFRKPA